jgi:hypothetical protein
MYRVAFARGCCRAVAGLLLVGVSACSTPSTAIPAAMVGGETFAGMSCSQLLGEKKRQAAVLKDLTHPPLFSSKSDAERRKEIAETQGEANVVDKEIADRSCAPERQSWSSPTAN